MKVEKERNNGDASWTSSAPGRRDIRPCFVRGDVGASLHGVIASHPSQCPSTPLPTTSSKTSRYLGIYVWIYTNFYLTHPVATTTHVKRKKKKRKRKCNMLIGAKFKRQMHAGALST